MFLQSLLDNHPKILMFPGLYLYKFMDFWEIYGKLTSDNLIKNFLKCFPYIIDAKKPGKMSISPVYLGDASGFTSMGESHNEILSINEKSFINAYMDLIGEKRIVTKKEFFQTIHVAYAKSLDKSFKLSDKHLIFHHIHDAEQNKAAAFLKDFPDAAFLHIIRDPLQSLGSHLSLVSKWRMLNTDVLISYLNDIFFGGIPVFEEYRERTRAVRLEDIHKKPRETLLSLVQWLGIDWSENLMISTFNGIKWWNLKDTSSNLSGFNKVTISRKHEEIFSQFDKFRLQYFVNRKCLHWGYQVYGADTEELQKDMLYHPFKFESYLQWWEYIFKSPRKIVRNFLIESIYKMSEFQIKEFELIKPGLKMRSVWVNKIPILKRENIYNYSISFLNRIEIFLPIIIKKILNLNPAIVFSFLKLINIPYRFFSQKQK